MKTMTTKAISLKTNPSAASLVFYSKIEVRLKKLQKQAIFGGVIFKASICSAKY